MNFVKNKYNRMRNLTLFLLTISIVISGCNFISAGTHGSLKGYQYNISKYELENAVNYVINENSKIHRDSAVCGYSYWADENGDVYQIDTLPDYYNDGENYLTITIDTDKGKYEYVFCYYGDKSYWDNSKSSEIFICYAYDEFRNGGSEGNGGVDKETLKYLVVS